MWFVMRNMIDKCTVNAAIMYTASHVIHFIWRFSKPTFQWQCCRGNNVHDVLQLPMLTSTPSCAHLQSGMQVLLTPHTCKASFSEMVWRAPAATLMVSCLRLCSSWRRALTRSSAPSCCCFNMLLCCSASDNCDLCSPIDKLLETE